MHNRIKVLFIDDNELDDEVRKIQRSLGKQGKALDPYFIDVNKPEFKEVKIEGGNLHLVMKKLIDHIEQQGLMELDFDIIACDFNFSDDYLNGYDLISDLMAKAKQNRNRIRRAKIVFYTGQVKVLKQVVVDDIKRFVNLKVDSIIDRPQIVEKVVRLSNVIGEEIALEEMFLNLLEPHKERVFKNTCPKFDGKKIEVIIHEIEKEQPNGRIYLNSLIEQTVAHMIKLQGE
jgi:hypothetical protein